MSGKRNLVNRMQVNRGLSSAGRNRSYTGAEVRLVKVSTAVSPKSVDSQNVITAGTGTALLTSLDDSGVLTDRTETISVLNMTDEVSANGSYIYVARVKSKWHFVGGESTGQPTLMFKTTTTISAGDPTNGSCGTGSANLWSLSGTVLSIDNTGLYDIVNPWATTVSQDKFITAYQDVNEPTKYVLLQAECEETSNGDGGTDPPTDPEGYCIDDTTGAVTSNVLQSECTGTWSSTEPTTGCCDISGTNNENVAESWCTTQGGTFTAGACPPSFDACAENARFKVTAITFADPNPTGCATIPWSVTGTSGNALGTPATGCTKIAYRGVTITSSENPPASTGVVDCNVTYNTVTGNWDLAGEIRYYNNAISGTTNVTMVGTLSNTLTACGDTISGNIFGTSAGNYSQSCDFSDGSAISGTITLELECF